VDKIVEQINTKYESPATKRRYYASIIKACECYSLKHKRSLIKIGKIYADIMRKLPTWTKKVDKLNISWRMVLDKYENIRNSHKNDYNKILATFVLNLYVNVEPRRAADYLECKIDIEGDDINTYYSSKGEFLFRKYKTVKKYGHQKITVNHEFKEMFDLYMNSRKYNGVDSEFLLCHKTGTRVNPSNGITVILNNVFYDKVSVNYLRSAYITHKFGNDINDELDTANAMGHSRDIQSKYSFK